MKQLYCQVPSIQSASLKTVKSNNLYKKLSTAVRSTESFLKETAKPKRASFATGVKLTVFEGHPVVAFHDHTLLIMKRDVFQTPVCDTSGQPRANIKKLVKEGKLDIMDDQSITSFANKYIVAKEYVVTAVRHIYENTVSANLRTEERASQTRQRKLKKFGDYDWQKLVEERELNTLYECCAA